MVKIAAILLLLSLSAHAGTSEPAAAAITFLEKLRSGNLNLEPGGDTALSPRTGREKREEIGQRLDRIGREIGSGSLEVAAVREDDGFAAVLIRKNGGFDPSDARVFAVAMVKKDAHWLAAPLPASFENVGAGHVLDARKRLDALEDWMLREQVVDLQKMQDLSGSLIRRKIEAVFPIERLKALDEKQVAKTFLSACADRDLPTVLALLGGLSTDLPGDWPARLKAADTAFGAKTARRNPWLPLTSKNSVRTVVHRSHGEWVIASLSPERRQRGTIIPTIRTIRLNLTRDTAGLWRVDPPEALIAGEPEESLEGDGSGVDKWVPEFPSAFSATHPPAFQADAVTAWEEFHLAIRAKNPEKMLATVDLLGSKPAALRNTLDAASLWFTIHEEPDARYPLPLSFKADENLAAGLLQVGSARTPGTQDFRTIYFTKSSGGWLWNPNPGADVRKEFQTWSKGEIRQWSGKWNDKLFKNVPVVTKEDFQEPPSDEEIRECITRWFAASREGDVLSALENIALLSEAGSRDSALRNIGYEISSAKVLGRETTILEIHRNDRIAAVGVKTAASGEAEYPFLPVVKTATGPKVLIEVDLFALPSRGFLNKVALEHLERGTNPEIAGKLGELFAAHSAKNAVQIPAGDLEK